MRSSLNFNKTTLSKQSISWKAPKLKRLLSPSAICQFPKWMKPCRYMIIGKRWRSEWWWHCPDTSMHGFSLRKLILKHSTFPTTSTLSRIPWTLEQLRLNWRIRVTEQSWISLQIWNWFSIIANCTMVKALMSAAWESKLERTTNVFASSTVLISI